MALTDVQHVEAVALINGILEHAPSLPPEIRRGAEGWLGEHHPPPSAYMAAMGMLAGNEPEAVGVDRGSELCQAHGAFNPEGDCFVCDAAQERERAEKAEAEWVENVLRAVMRQRAADFNLDTLKSFISLDRDRCEQALERLESEDRVRAVYTGRDRPHWSLVID